MSGQALTAPGELGEIGSEAIRELVSRATGGNPIASYAEDESPLRWEIIAEGGWDVIGVEDDETVPLRDLVEVAKAWGSACVPLPLLTTIVAKRHSSVAREIDGPLTMSLPVGREGRIGLIPYGQIPGIGVLRTVGLDVPGAVESISGEANDFDLLLRATDSPWTSEFSPGAAKEFAMLLAAESLGAAERLLDEGLAYVKDRRQFGKPIGSFQAVKHHLANALVDVQAADTAVIWGSLFPQEKAFQAARFALDRSLRAAETVLQVEGGMGFTWELGLHLPMRRIITSRDIVTGLEVHHG